MIPAVADSVSKAELVELGRRWLEHAPAASDGPPGLLGHIGPAGFICANCAGRIAARGCDLGRLAPLPLYLVDTARRPKCALCGR